MAVSVSAQEESHLSVDRNHENGAHDFRVI